MLLSVLHTIATLVGIGMLGTAAYKTYDFLTLFFFSIPSPEAQLQQYKHAKTHATTPANTPDPVHWALITGSSAGIGYGYASHLLSLGFGVILLAHIPTQVAEAEASLRSAYPDGSIRSVVLDCRTASIQEMRELVESVADLRITVLINNVGGIPTSYPHFRPFEAFAPEDIDAHFDMNARFMTHLTGLMLPHLIRNAHPRSLILNVTSAARWGLPYLSMYSATKAHVSTFSHTLAREMKMFKKPVDCLLVVPGDVHSEGNCIGVAPGSPDALQYGRMVLERVDGAVARGRVEISAFWKHALQIAALEWLPESVTVEEAYRASIRKKEAWAREHEKEE